MYRNLTHPVEAPENRLSRCASSQSSPSSLIFNPNEPRHSLAAVCRSARKLSTYWSKVVVIDMARLSSVGVERLDETCIGEEGECKTGHLDVNKRDGSLGALILVPENQPTWEGGNLIPQNQPRHS